MSFKVSYALLRRSKILSFFTRLVQKPTKIWKKCIWIGQGLVLICAACPCKSADVMFSCIYVNVLETDALFANVLCKWMEKRFQAT